jgi:hypothetical protein
VQHSMHLLIFIRCLAQSSPLATGAHLGYWWLWCCLQPRQCMPSRHAFL